MRKVLILVFGFFIVFIGCAHKKVKFFPKYDYYVKSETKILESDVGKETKMSMPKFAGVPVVKK